MRQSRGASPVVDTHRCCECRPRSARRVPCDLPPLWSSPGNACWWQSAALRRSTAALCIPARLPWMVSTPPHTQARSVRSIPSFLWSPCSFDATIALSCRALEDGNKPPHIYWALPSAAGVRTCFNGSFATCLWKTAPATKGGTSGIERPRGCKTLARFERLCVDFLWYGLLDDPLADCLGPKIEAVANAPAEVAGDFFAACIPRLILRSARYRGVGYGLVSDWLIP
jgi:hypothetical protein